MSLEMPLTTTLAQFAALPSSVPVHQALELTQGGQLAQILLNDQVYSLRITRAGKLILTK